MAQPNQQPGSDPSSIVKGKSPRNAILAVGAVAAIVIAAIGFYYQLKQTNEAADEAKLQRKERESAAVHKEVSTNDDVDKIIDDQITATSGGVPGLTPGTVTTGNFLNILPSVNDHNQIILAYWSDTSKLNGPFTNASVGSGQTEQQIQLAHTIGNKDDQTLSLADGQTVVIYGAMTDQNNSTTTGGIGGITGTWNKAHTFQVIMLTATVVPSM